MAIIQLAVSTNMTNSSVWYGVLAGYDANHIIIQNGGFEGVYTGYFSFPGDGHVYGTLTGYAFYINGVKYGDISFLNVDAHFAELHIQSNDLQPLFQVALAGNDQFFLYPGTHTINGEGGYNTAYEPGSSYNYTYNTSGGAILLNSSTNADTLYNIQGVYFSNGFADFLNGTFTFNGQPTVGFASLDLTTGKPATTAPQVYNGPVGGLQNEFVEITSDKLNISVTSDNWFIHTGSGTDAIQVKGGTNVLDGGTSSNFLVGGNGFDTFFVDDRAATSDIWSTVVNFHANDAATIWGVSPQDFQLSWADNQGAAGYTGLTLHATAGGRPTASLTFAGYSTADLNNGRLAVSFGHDSASGSNYMYIHS